MNNNSTFFERLMQLAHTKGIKNTQQLSEYLGYKSPEKLYRLERDANAKPSFAILLDISNKFDNCDLNYLVTGKVKKYQVNDIENNINEGSQTYLKDDAFMDKVKLLKSLFHTDNSAIENKIDDLSTIMSKFFYELKDLQKKINKEAENH